MGGRTARAIRVGAVVLGLGTLTLTGSAVGQQPTDTRQRVVRTAAARDKILAEMRDMLGALHGVIRALSADDLATAEQAARSAGIGVAVDVKPEVRAQLPPPFLQLGMQTHRAFDTLADQLKAGVSGQETLKAITGLTGNCVACHAVYRLDEAR